VQVVQLCGDTLPSRSLFAQRVQLFHLCLRSTVVGPEVLSYALFFELTYLCCLIRQVKDAPLFSGFASASVLFYSRVHACASILTLSLKKQKDELLSSS